MLLAVPSVAADGQVLQGPKLLASWASSYSFSATKTLFSDAPELLATWRQSTQRDTQVLKLKERGEWREAWTLVAASIVAAHVGDRLMALRKKVRAPQHLLQHGDKTVAKIATAHLEDVQAAKVLGLWDPLATLLHDLEYDAKLCDGYRVFRLGLDLGRSEDLATHHHVMEFLCQYLDRQRALELFGALRPEIQTLIENSESGRKLLGSCLDTAFTWDEVLTLATEFETREKARDADVARQLKKLGVEVPKQGKGGRNAQARRVGAKGKDGKGKGGRGGNRRTRRQGSQRDDATPGPGAGSPAAGLDGIVSAHVQCYGCQKHGHVKKKGGVVNCPWWVVAADGSEYYDANPKAAVGASAPSAPRAVVDQVTPAPTPPLPSTSTR
jgi:hypothetical protein